jgi:anthranilate/para-aminobenzoate synthase component I
VCIEVMPRVTTHATVHHREAVLTGRTNASREAVLSAMVPSGSVTGAPKVRAMEVIAELESDRRGLYTGGIGYVARDGAVTLSMAIRTLVVRGDQGFYFTGGGIVLDSDPERERLETEWKARRLFDALSSAHPVPSKISGVP